MAVVFETAFLEQQIPGITDNDIAKGVINYYKAEYMSQGATVADIYNVAAAYDNSLADTQKILLRQSR